VRKGGTTLCRIPAPRVKGRPSRGKGYREGERYVHREIKSKRKGESSRGKVENVCGLSKVLGGFLCRVRTSKHAERVIGEKRGGESGGFGSERL